MGGSRGATLALLAGVGLAASCTGAQADDAWRRQWRGPTLDRSWSDPDSPAYRGSRDGLSSGRRDDRADGRYDGGRADGGRYDGGPTDGPTDRERDRQFEHTRDRQLREYDRAVDEGDRVRRRFDGGLDGRLDRGRSSGGRDWRLNEAEQWHLGSPD